MIHVIARIEVKEGQQTAFLKEFHQIVPTVLEESGCLSYGPTVDAVTDIPRQQTNPDIVTIIEKWESLETLNAHLDAPHMQQYRERVGDLIVGVTLNILQPA